MDREGSPSLVEKKQVQHVESEARGGWRKAEQQVLNHSEDLAFMGAMGHF